MQQVQLYIEGQRVDMFKDESVVITDTLKDVKDISKIFTEYSQTFQIPASRINNKVFKHYYNNDIMEGFDARVRTPARIELNSLPFKDGFIQLEGVDLIDNKAHTYRITFFGNTVSLKDLVGDDLLSDLEWLDNFSKKDSGVLLINSASDIEFYLKNNTSRTVDGVTYQNPVQVPLLTHTQRLTYKSNEDVANSGNVHYNNGSSANNIHGVKWNELKYAIKLEIIIKAITNKYAFQLDPSKNFFNGVSNSFDELYMWLHRTKGAVSTGSQVTQYNKFVSGWTNAVGNVSKIEDNSRFTITSNLVDDLYLNIIPVNADLFKEYSISVYRSGSVVFQSTSASGNRTFSNIPIVSGFAYTVEVSSTQAINFSSVGWYVQIIDSQNDVYLTSFNITAQFLFNIQQQIPEMKVLDFLTSIFKMFNLVAYFENGFLVVQPLDEYYSLGRGGNLNALNGYDITKYVSTSEKQVDVALPFREINYSYKGLNTFLAKQHNQLFNEQWGTEEYSGESSLIFSEGIFKVKAEFEHMKFEKLIDLAQPTVVTDIQWGFCVDDNKSSYIGSPLIFYMYRETLNVGGEISFVYDVNSDNVATDYKSIANYYVPSNSDLSQSQVEDRQSINFSPEYDEWELKTTQQSLFNNYHKKYISGVFTESNRLTTISAYLPLSILLKYNLADRFIISGKSYKINSIETDFYTGKSSIELLNDDIILPSESPQVVNLIAAENGNNLTAENGNFLQTQ